MGCETKARDDFKFVRLTERVILKRKMRKEVVLMVGPGAGTRIWAPKTSSLKSPQDTCRHSNRTAEIGKDMSVWDVPIQTDH